MNDAHLDKSLRELQHALTKAAGSGHDAALAMERGQATTPIADSFAAVRQEVDAAPLPLVVLGFDAESKGKAVSFLTGDDTHLFWVKVVQAGFVELLLQDRSFVFEANGQRQEFDDIRQFISALEEKDVLKGDERGSWSRPLELGVRGAAGRKGLRLVIPDSADALFENPRLSTRLRQKASAGVLALGKTPEFSPKQRRKLVSTFEGFDTLFLLCMGDAPTEDQVRAWLKFLDDAGIRLRVAPTVAGSSFADSDLNWLTDEQSPLRSSLLAARALRSYESSIDLLRNEQAQQLRKIEVRLGQVARDAGDAGQATHVDLKGTVDVAKQRFSGGLTSLEEAVQSTVREKFSSRSSSFREIDGEIDSFGERDFDLATLHKSTSLSLKSDALARIGIGLRAHLKSQLWSTTELVDETLAVLQTETQALLEEVLGRPWSMHVPPFDAQPLFDALESETAVSVRYKGEIPNRTFVQRLSQGRQSMFILMMFASLLSPMIPGIRGHPVVYVGALALFVVGLLLSIRSFASEREERVGKELDRARDAVRSEVSKAVTETTRNHLGLITKHLRRVGRCVTEELDELLRAETQRVQEDFSRKQEEARSGQRSLDRRRQELLAVSKQIESAGHAIEVSRTALVRLFSECGKALAGTGAGG